MKSYYETKGNISTIIPFKNVNHIVEDRTAVYVYMFNGKFISVEASDIQPFVEAYKKYLEYEFETPSHLFHAFYDLAYRLSSTMNKWEIPVTQE